VPRAWSTFSIDYRFGGSSYSIEVLDPTGIAESGASYQLDGKRVSTLELVDDDSDHHVIVSPDNPENSNFIVSISPNFQCNRCPVNCALGSKGECHDNLPYMRQ
jgi:hypothetical protein